MVVPRGWTEGNEEKRRCTVRRCCSKISRGSRHSAPRKKAPVYPPTKDTIFACIYLGRSTSINSVRGEKEIEWQNIGYKYTAQGPLKRHKFRVVNSTVAATPSPTQIKKMRSLDFYVYLKRYVNCSALSVCDSHILHAKKKNRRGYLCQNCQREATIRH